MSAPPRTREESFGNFKNILWNISSNFTVLTVGCLSKLWLEGLNTTFVYNEENWLSAIESRESGRSLLTVCNHTSTADDPLLFGLLPLRVLIRPSLVRWGLGAADVCFTKTFHGTFFALGKVIPVIRGAGVYQRGMDAMLERMNLGDWVHVFPEGKVNLQQEWMRIKWGVGRLVAESELPPLVLPFWHEGLHEVLPMEKPYRPRVGRRVTVVFGDVIDTRVLLEQLRSQHTSPESLRKALTDYIQSELKKIREKARAMHYVADRPVASAKLKNNLYCNSDVL